MALKLKKIDALFFQGKAGDTVLLDISVAQVSSGTPADILAISYNGETVQEAPYQFKVAKGDNGLVVVYASTPGTQVLIQEADAANPSNRQTLAKQFYDPADPAAVILIRA